MSIVKKMIIGYFVIIVFPVLGFGSWFYNTSYLDLTDRYAQGKRQVIEQFYGNLQFQLNQIETTQEQFQYNANVVDYLSGSHLQEVDSVYALLKYIHPLFAHLYIGNPNIKEMVLYSRRPNVLPIEPIIAPEGDFPFPAIRREIDRLPANKGLWRLEFDAKTLEPDLRYFQKLYNKEFSKEIGLLEIRVKSSLINGFLSGLIDDPNIGKRLVSEKSLVMADLEVLESIQGDEKALESVMGVQEYDLKALPRRMIHALNVSELGLSVAVIERDEAAMAGIRKKQYTYIATIAALMLLLSYMYYSLAVSITRRIKKLAKHMKQIDSKNLSAFSGGSVKNDEVGFLTSSFNRMIGRIDELVNSVQRSEIMRKEAEYLMLQAQIKPHFLYNTLETIRMLAHSNGDVQVSELTNSLARFIRYSLSRQNDTATIADELEHIGNYLTVHRTRFGARMKFEIEVGEGVSSQRCPRFILQPLVENSIEHGISKTRRKGLIHIRCIRTDGGNILITIFDNGPGIEEQNLADLRARLDGTAESSQGMEHPGGIGLCNVHERIRMFYGGHSGLTIDSAADGEGTTVTITMDDSEGGRQDENHGRGR